MAIKHFLQFNDLNRDELEHVFARASWIKNQFKTYQQYWPLQDRTLVMIFETFSPVVVLLMNVSIQNGAKLGEVLASIFRFLRNETRH